LEDAKRWAATGQVDKDVKRATEEAARKAATGQAGTAKRASEEAKRKAARQAVTAKRASEEAKRKAVTEQEGTAKRVSEEAKRWGATGQADKEKHAGKKPRLRLQRGKETRSSAYLKKPPPDLRPGDAHGGVAPHGADLDNRERALERLPFEEKFDFDPDSDSRLRRAGT
jgi:hypothetical protein